MSALPTPSRRALAHLIVSILLTALTASALNSCRRRPGSQVIARVGEIEIRMADLSHEARRWATLGMEGRDRDQVLDELVRRQTLVAYAHVLGLDRQPEVRRSYENLLIGRLKRQELEPRLRAATVDDEDPVPTEPGSVLPSDRSPERRLAVLRLQLPPHASPERRTRLAGRMAEARQRAAQMPALATGFGSLAAEFSDDPDARHSGGDLGWFSDTAPDQRIDPAALAAGFALHRPGDLSEVVTTPRGFYLVALMGLRNPGPAAQATEGARRRRANLQKMRRAVEAEFHEYVRAQVPVTVYADALQQMDWPDDQPVLARSDDDPPGVPSVR